MTKSGVSRQLDRVDESDRRSGPGLDAFDALYDREFAYVWKTLGRLGVAPADLADATHDVFVVAYRRWDEYDATRPIRGWLFGIARRVAAGRRRKRSESLDPAPEPAGSDGERLADRDLVWKALAELSDDQCAVIVLHDLEGRTGAEIAELLELPVNTVHSRLRLARARFVLAVRRMRGER